MSLASIWNIARRDVEIPKSAPTEFLLEKHKEFLIKYGKARDTHDYVLTEYLRMSGCYWLLGAMDVLGVAHEADTDFISNFVKVNQNGDGGFAAAEKHDSHLLHTLSAVQILKMLKRMDLLDRDKAVSYIKSLQNEDGSFSGDTSGEIDTRFSFCALASLYLLDRLSAVDVKKAVEFVLRCYNFDGGFGTRPGSESHSGQVYCCLGALTIAGSIDKIDVNRTGEWLAERQCQSGGLCGRPEKLPDVCYSWWVMASLAMIGKLHWIDKVSRFQDSITKFILAAQDDEDGGIADRPDDMPDPFHTFFGLSGLSLLRFGGLEAVDPVMCMTKRSLGDHAFDLR